MLRRVSTIFVIAQISKSLSLPVQGGGVAVTPFLSILKQLVREYENSRCTRCQKVSGT